MKKVCVFILLVLTSNPAMAEDPLEFVKARYNDIQEIIKVNREREKVRQGIREVMERFVDYVELSKRTLGNEWQKLKQKERDEFIAEFKRMIQRTYVKRFNPDTEVAIEYRKATKNDDGTAVVESIVRSGRSEARVDYKLLESKGRWWAYDVVIDEVSMVQNYRKQFTDIIAKSGFKGLLDKMRKKNEKAED